MAHNVFVEEVDRGRDVVYRWECSCRKSGRPVKSRSYAEELGEKHAARYVPKPPKSNGPKALSNLLKLED